MRGGGRLAVSLVAALGALLAAGEARAQATATWWSMTPASYASGELPDATSPPSLIDVTHRGFWYGLETTFASLKPHDAVTGPQARSFVWTSRLEGEWAVVGRRWYVGLAESMGYGQPPGGKDGAVVVGYPEIWARAVWATRSGLAYGGGLSLVAPIFKRSPDSTGALASEAMRVVRPWDFTPFAENTFSVQPYLDARVIDGRVTFQLRQGFVLQGLVAQARLPDFNVVSRTTLFLGYQPATTFSLGLELQEVYFISADFQALCQTRRTACDDSLRAAFAVSPSIRLLTRAFQPSLSAMVPFDRTLFDSVRSYWAVRIGLSAIYDD